MASENQSGMQPGSPDRAASGRAGVVQCVEVEALLAEALDGTLHGSQLAAFEAHQQSCPACRTLVAEAGAGMHWLKGLDEAEPPRNLVHNILAQTIGALPSEHIVPVQRGEGWLEKLKGRLAPLFASGGYSALCHVVRHGVLLHYLAAGHRRLPPERPAQS